MKLARFFSRYTGRYVLWAVLAGVAIPIYALASAYGVSLIEPIFGEVLQAQNEMPGIVPVIPASPAGKDEEGGLLHDLNLKRLANRSYEALKRQFDINSDNVVFFTPLLFFAVFILRGLADFGSGYAFQHIGLGITTDIRNDLYRNLLEQSSRFHARHTSGELVSRVVNDVAQMQVAVSTRLLDFVQQSVTLLFLLALLLSTHFELAVICIVLTPAVVYPIVRFGKGMRRTSHRSQERMAELTDLLSQGVRGHRVVKAFGMEDFEYGRFAVATRRHMKVNLWAQMLANVSSPVIGSLVTLGSVSFLIYAGLQIRSGELTTPLLVQFMLNLLLMQDPIRKLNKVNLVLQQALAAAHRVADLLAIPNEVADRPHAQVLEDVREGVRFEDVRFAYDNVPVIKNVSLTVERGEIVALVGPSGAGKTTLVNLLPRFFDPDSGRVSIDGQDIRSFTLKSLRKQIGMVTQETILFNDTVRNNIAYGRRDLALEQVREAARQAYADEFISELPEGYEMHIGESGSFLSGGQRQRLAIARALIKDAPILILDEATSQLDSESESLVQKALYNLMRGRATMVIAHRLSTIMKANRIVVMEAGRIVDVGPHAELLARGGTYKRLFDLQFRQKEPA